MSKQNEDRSYLDRVSELLEANPFQLVDINVMSSKIDMLIDDIKTIHIPADEVESSMVNQLVLTKVEVILLGDYGIKISDHMKATSQPMTIIEFIQGNLIPLLDDREDLLTLICKDILSKNFEDIITTSNVHTAYDIIKEIDDYDAYVEELEDVFQIDDDESPVYEFIIIEPMDGTQEFEVTKDFFDYMYLDGENAEDTIYDNLKLEEE